VYPHNVETLTCCSLGWDAKIAMLQESLKFFGPDFFIFLFKTERTKGASD
jgi:hypothetical protein